jgi:uncharacterized protein (DUF2235 family)
MSDSRDASVATMDRTDLLRCFSYNPAIGEFATLDPSAGDPTNPLSYNKYVYTQGDPVNGYDPTGMSFFAFDGTGNWENEYDNGVWAPTNIYKLYKSSLDPNAHYYRGVGNEADYEGGALTRGERYGEGMYEILAEAWKDLAKDRSKGDHTADIIGFSRGGIQAIQFANWIHDNFPDEKIRFVGLFDPVGSVGSPLEFGGYQTTLPDNVARSAEALALDENRTWFSPVIVPGATREWFKGTHSDIGGGWAAHGLSDITLLWMATKAQQAGVSIDLNRWRRYMPIEPNPKQPVDSNPWWYFFFSGGSRDTRLVIDGATHAHRYADAYWTGQNIGISSFDAGVGLP